ncbi:MAG: hypothetical protein K0S54_725 [Alphaproteobacteria bacterium]|jgi:hypothetical protein|nr:hypothetical protein [Alphaproteobacteria bacterium]
MAEQAQRLAVLIDADNASAAIVDDLLAEIAKLGTASVKRIYGDFTTGRLAAWNARILEHSIQQVQQPSFTTGKNASDIALVIDAMDLLHSKRFTGFCLVSSDSDFTRLAMRLREEGVIVYGFGEKKTPRAFVAACDKFIYTEILRPPKKRAASPARPAAKPPGRPVAKPAPRPASSDISAPPLDILRDAIDSSADESGWAHLGQVGRVLNNRLPDFDARNFGYRSTGAMLEELEGFEIRRQGGPGQQQTVYVKVKPGA